MRRPNKPHKDGFEDEEDCEGYYDPDEAERRECHKITTSQRSPKDPCWVCFKAWKAKDGARRKAEYDALTDEEKERRAEFLRGLRELY